MSRCSEQRGLRPAAGEPLWRRAALQNSVIIVGAVLIAFHSALRGEFLGWDDDFMFVNEVAWRGLGWRNLGWMFSTFHMGHYQPLAWLSAALNHAVGGMEPFGYHLVNVLLHAATAVAFYFLARGLLRRAAPAGGSFDGAALFAALFFAIHPLRVESVAWLTERRDVLSGVFFVATLLAYLRGVEPQRAEVVRPGWHVAAFGLMLLSLLAKAWGMALPLLMLLIDVYPLRRGRLPRLVGQKIPFLVLSIAAAVVAGRAQAATGLGMLSFERHPLSHRLVQALYGVAYYPLRTLLPRDLGPIYEIPIPMRPADPVFLFGGAVAVALCLAAWLLRRRFPAFTAAWVWYLLTVAPVLGLTQSGWQLVADRYSYLSCMGFAMAVAGGAAMAIARLPVSQHRLAAVPGMVVLALFAGQTHRYCYAWRSSRALWERALAVAPNSWHAHLNLGTELFRAGDLAAAQEAVVGNPTSVSARENYSAALDHFEKAVAGNPLSGRAWHNYGAALDRLGRPAEAEAAWVKALPLNPERGRTLCELGKICAQQKRFDEAIRMFDEAVRTSTHREFVARGHGGLGTVYRALGRIDEAIAELEIAHRMLPQAEWIRRELEFARKSALIGRPHNNGG